jgi:thiol-disulfide isomerase/thioredoxin
MANKILLLFLFNLLLIENKIYPLCPPTNIYDFKTFLAKNPTIENILFFSTWCADCKDELIKLKDKIDADKKYILVNEFDAKGRAEKSLQNLNINLPCFYDEDKSIALEYQVKYVPTKIVLPLNWTQTRKNKEKSTRVLPVRKEIFSQF